LGLWLPPVRLCWFYATFVLGPDGDELTIHRLCRILDRLFLRYRTVKRIVETLWSTRYDAVFAIKSHYENVVDALEKLSEQSENADTRASRET